MHQQSDIVYQKENKVVPKPEEFLQWWERKSEIQAFMEPLAFNHRTLRRGLLVNATVFLFFLTADWTLDDEVCVLSVRSNYTLLKMINCCCSWCCKNDKMFGTCLFNLHLLWIILKKIFNQPNKMAIIWDWNWDKAQVSALSIQMTQQNKSMSITF